MKDKTKALIQKLSLRGLLNWLPDKAYLKLMFKVRMGKKLNLKNPQTFNEKLQWLKLYDRKPKYTMMVDKFEVKKYISEKIGEEYVISTLGVWDKFDDIDFEKLPNQFVLKCTHDSGGLVICKDKSKLDIAFAKQKIERSLKKNYYWHGREWPYKNVKPRIIAEKLMKDGDNSYLPVYKFMCFNGQPLIIQTIQNDKQPNESVDYFDIEWNLLNIKQNFPNSENPLARPKELEQMRALAEKLSKGHAFIRVDLYVINGKLYFSEYTFYSDCGLVPFYPEKWDDVLGQWISLCGKNSIK